MESIQTLKEYYKLIEELWNDQRVEQISFLVSLICKLPIHTLEPGRN